MIVHAFPDPDISGVTPCCGKRRGDLDEGDRLALYDVAVTCGVNDDALLASVMRKLLTTEGYASIDTMFDTLTVDTSGVELTAEERQAVERLWEE